MGVNLMLQSDLRAITEAIDQTTGIGYVELLVKRRSSTLQTLAKTAVCHFLHERGYPCALIAQALNRSRYLVPYLLRKHEDMMFSDLFYQRLIDQINHQLTRQQQ